ncbi:MAG: GNAT family N-acetyltransferase [Anaerolineae bacterium]|nr:GNAT family N-acetyltransferase [Anaerolineae bacterium]
MLKIAPIEKQHIVACAHIMATNPLWQRYNVTEEKALRLFSSIPSDDTARVSVALLNEEVAGFIWYYLRGTFFSGGYIRLVGVSIQHKRQGIGTVLMDVAENDISQHTPDTFLLASDFNIPAHDFYRQRGYQNVGQLPDFAMSGISELIFWKRIQQKKEAPAAKRAT